MTCKDIRKNARACEIIEETNASHRFFAGSVTSRCSDGTAFNVQNTATRLGLKTGNPAAFFWQSLYVGAGAWFTASKIGKDDSKGEQQWHLVSSVV